MSPQLSYDHEMQKAIPGMVSDLTDKTIISRAAEGDVDFGLALVQGTDPQKQVKVPTASAVFEGVSAERFYIEQDLATGEGVNKDGESVAVLRKGRIWVHIDQDVAINDPVYFRHTSSLGKEGYFRKDISGGEADLVPTAIFRRTATAAEGLTEIEINLP